MEKIDGEYSKTIQYYVLTSEEDTDGKIKPVAKKIKETIKISNSEAENINTAINIASENDNYNSDIDNIENLMYIRLYMNNDEKFKNILLQLDATMNKDYCNNPAFDDLFGEEESAEGTAEE